MKKSLLALSYALIFLGSATIIAMNQEEGNNEWTADSTVTVHRKTQQNVDMLSVVKLKIADNIGFLPYVSGTIDIDLSNVPGTRINNNQCELLINVTDLKPLFDKMKAANHYFSQKEFDETVQHKVAEEVKSKLDDAVLEELRNSSAEDRFNIIHTKGYNIGRAEGHRAGLKEAADNTNIIQRYPKLSLGIAALLGSGVGAVGYKGVGLAYSWWQARN